MGARDYFNKFFQDISEIQRWQQVGHYAGLKIEAKGNERRLVDHEGNVDFEYEVKE